MAYAQLNYSQKLGSGEYSISAAGCFLTAFCNLLGRFGENIDPPALNNYFAAHSVYLHDPAEPAVTRDDLTWSSVAAYDSTIGTDGTGPGWPSTNDAIVKFIYTSPHTGQKVIHFCLVANASAHEIVDSYDGVTKVSPYGTPVEWCAYVHHVVQPVTPPAPVEQSAFTVEPIAETTKELKVDTHIWDLNQRSWPGLVNNPVGTANAGATFKTSAIAHHILGGQYYLPEGSTTQGYNVVDTEDPVNQPQAPAPTPPPVTNSYSENVIDGITFQTIDGSPKQMWISRPGGAEKWSFKDVTTWRGFKSVEHLSYGSEIFISGVAHHPIPPKGADYYMTSDDFGNFKKTGQPTNYCGFNWSDISDKKPPALPDPAPAPVVIATTPTVPEVVPPATVVTTPPADSSAPIDWQSTYRPFPKPIKYISTHDQTVNELSNQQPAMKLPKFNPDATPEQGVVQAYGKVTYEGIDYYRLKTNNDPAFTYWYCVPTVDTQTRTPNLLVYPTVPVSPISRANGGRDILDLGLSKIEATASTFFDDMIPKWFKNKK